MKIDKIIFSCSTDLINKTQAFKHEYSRFWNIQSKIWKTIFDIEPVCLLFGKKSDTDMTEEYGKIIEMDILPDIPLIIQLTWSKFYFPTLEPTTTWIMGDIDLIPLQKKYFIDNIKNISDDFFVHLNAGGNCMNQNIFLEKGSQIHMNFGKNGNNGCDLPGHYWVGKGKKFELFTQNSSFKDQLKYIVESKKYGMGAKALILNQDFQNNSSINSDSFLWCAEEMRSSELMWNAIKDKKIDFFPSFYGADQRIDRSTWNHIDNDYTYNPKDLENNKIVDIHCMRPYSIQENALIKIINKANF